MAISVAGVFAAAVCAAVPPTANHPWRAIHFICYHDDAGLMKLEEQLPQLAKAGINCVILEMNYNFEYQSHPELRQGERQITKGGARQLVEACRKNDIELVPQFQCLGHQSWKENTSPLLVKYPELDLTPDVPSDTKGFYCREWNPLDPKVNEIIFPLIDELVDAFDAKAVHVGMDEVFLLASEHAKTKDHDPAEVFAKTVKDLHEHIVGQRGLTMLMWADRLIDGKLLNMGEWEASQVGTAASVDKIPKDIILCPWHYEPREGGAYESVPMLMEKGFRVMPASWKNTDAGLALIRFAREHETDGRLVGHIFTTWSGAPDKNWAEWEPVAKGLALLQSPDGK
ncbi:MAG TPA: family 20 glycosylhydrolase [Lacipirellulaceae bacterium]|jgi:hypothetical protein